LKKSESSEGDGIDSYEAAAIGRTIRNRSGHLVQYQELKIEPFFTQGFARQGKSFFEPRKVFGISIEA
jgi:hypothetical protein